MTTALVKCLLASLLLTSESTPGLSIEDSAQIVFGRQVSRVRVHLVMAPASGLFREESDYWGAVKDSGRVVTDLKMEVSGGDVWVPRSAFSDLANVNTMTIRKRQDSVEVTLRGGDGPLAYVCTLRLRKGQVVLRKVASEISDAWEKTVYHPPKYDK